MGIFYVWLAFGRIEIEYAIYLETLLFLSYSVIYHFEVCNIIIETLCITV